MAFLQAHPGPAADGEWVEVGRVEVGRVEVGREPGEVLVRLPSAARN